MIKANALKSKTINFSLILAVLGVVEMNLPMVKDMLGDYYGISFMVIAAIVAGLRVVTKAPLSDK